MHFLQGFFYGTNFVLKVNQSTGRIIDRILKEFRYMNKNDPIIVIEDDEDDRDLFKIIYEKPDCENELVLFPKVSRLWNIRKINR